MSGFSASARSPLSLSIALAALVSGCIDTMSVGTSPLATVDANITVGDDASPYDAGAKEAGVELDSGARPPDAGDAQPIDAQRPDARAPDAEIADAGASDAALRDAATRDAQVDASSRDAAAADAGLERCEEVLCQIAGISPTDESCPGGSERACVKEETGCFWTCL